MVMSVEASVLESHMDELLALYRDSLEESLKDLGLESLECPSLEDVKAEVRKLGLLGFTQAATSLAFITNDPKDAVEVEDLLEEFEKTNEVKLNLKPYTTKAYTTKLKYILKTCDEWGVFG
jgi:hypothetical protein